MTISRITRVESAGASGGGEDLYLKLILQDGSAVELSVHHSLMSELMSAVAFAGQVAARQRPATTTMGAAMPALHHLMPVEAAAVLALPDGCVALRLEVGQAPMEFRLQPGLAQAIRDGIGNPPTPPKAGRSSRH